MQTWSYQLSNKSSCSIHYKVFITSLIHQFKQSTIVFSDTEKIISPLCPVYSHQFFKYIFLQSTLVWYQPYDFFQLKIFINKSTKNSPTIAFTIKIWHLEDPRLLIVRENPRLSICRWTQCIILKMWWIFVAIILSSQDATLSILPLCW